MLFTYMLCTQYSFSNFSIKVHFNFLFNIYFKCDKYLCSENVFRQPLVLVHNIETNDL